MNARFHVSVGRVFGLSDYQPRASEGEDEDGTALASLQRAQHVGIIQFL